jgi:hypothetical protein
MLLVLYWSKCVSDMLVLLAVPELLLLPVITTLLLLLLLLFALLVCTVLRGLRETMLPVSLSLTVLPSATEAPLLLALWLWVASLTPVLLLLLPVILLLLLLQLLMLLLLLLLPLTLAVRTALRGLLAAMLLALLPPATLLPATPKVPAVAVAEASWAVDVLPLLLLAPFLWVLPLTALLLSAELSPSAPAVAAALVPLPLVAALPLSIEVDSMAATSSTRGDSPLLTSEPGDSVAGAVVPGGFVAGQGVPTVAACCACWSSKDAECKIKLVVSDAVLAVHMSS